ncbi:MAG: ferrichrome ABC transporter permease, partial [Verrucomicrobiota bacterium]
MVVFLSAVFLSAFLLFQVQPILARYILPWYGGSPAVWTSCLLFFQLGLLGGYAYAHLLVSRFRNRPAWQVGIHLAVVAVALLFLPIAPSEALRPSGTEASPVSGILLLLFSTVGLPFVAISASSPLLQHWFGEAKPNRSPYRLYAVSNAGSLLGLLTYPVLIEPIFRLREQTMLWSGGFLLFALLTLAGGVLYLRRRQGNSSSPDTEMESGDGSRWGDQILWVALSGCGSVFLLGVTNQMSQDVAVVPFLWVLPLSLYLLTFIIAFDHPRWYFRPVWIPLAGIGVIALTILLTELSAGELPLGAQIAIFSAALFPICLVCHGELVRRKPPRRDLTRFYLAVSLGGAIGGIAVGVLAPRVFSDYLELPIAIIAVVLLAGLCLFREGRNQKTRTLSRHLAEVLWASMLLVLAVQFWRDHSDEKKGLLASSRSFFGVLSVHESRTVLGEPYRSLDHGEITHGQQFLDEDLRALPSSYFSRGSGPWVAFERHPKRKDENKPVSLSYGVVGLGVGTLAT